MITLNYKHISKLRELIEFEIARLEAKKSKRFIPTYPTNSALDNEDKSETKNGYLDEEDARIEKELEVLRSLKGGFDAMLEDINFSIGPSSPSVSIGGIK